MTGTSIQLQLNDLWPAGECRTRICSHLKKKRTPSLTNNMYLCSYVTNHNSPTDFYYPDSASKTQLIKTQLNYENKKIGLKIKCPSVHLRELRIQHMYVRLVK